MLTPTSDRLEELERRFAALEGELPATPEKEAISLLHAILLENRRLHMVAGTKGHANGKSGKPTIEQVANLYRTAPPVQGAAENVGLPVGIAAPDFTLPDGNGKLVTLSDLRGQNVVLVFYPLDWSPACSDQLSLYQSELREFERHNARVVGLSVDSLYSHGAWAAVRGITFPLLSDFNPKGKVARRYQVMREIDGFSERALYIVDANGIIRYAYVSPQLHQVPDIYELFEQLAAVSGAPAAS